MTIPSQIAMWAAGIIFVLGSFQGVVLWRLSKIEKMLGNGVPGVFPRREEVKLMIAEAAEECRDA